MTGTKIPICYDPNYCFGGFFIEPCTNPAIPAAITEQSTCHAEKSVLKVLYKKQVKMMLK